MDKNDLAILRSKMTDFMQNYSVEIVMLFHYVQVTKSMIHLSYNITFMVILELMRKQYIQIEFLHLVRRFRFLISSLRFGFKYGSMVPFTVLFSSKSADMVSIWTMEP